MTEAGTRTAAPRWPAAPPLRTAALVLLALASAGCSLLQGVGPAGGGETAGGPEAPEGRTTNDTASVPATDPAARAAASEDSVRRRIAAEDSAYRVLLDSARALARGGGEPAARPEADTATAGEGEESEDTEETTAAEDGYPAGPVTITDVEKLKELGPVYTPYERGPTLRMREAQLDGLLKATLVPVIRRYELPPDEWARYWILVDREGRVQASRLQLPSGHSSFDEAARAVAESLGFVPARRGGEPVPVWILTRISLLMR